MKLKAYRFEGLFLILLMFFLVPVSFLSVSGLVVEDVGVSNVYYIALDESLLPFFLVSFSDNNMVWIYSLDDGVIKQETEVSLEALVPYHYTPVGLFIKIVSEEPIMVYMIGLEGGNGGTNYPSVSGEFVGKNFIVFPLPSTVDYNSSLEIWALEPGLVTIRYGTESFSIPVFPGLFTRFEFEVADEDRHKVYFNITSDVDIILCGGVRDGWLPGPTITGFVGKVHYGYTRALWDPGLGGVQITAFEPGFVTITNLTDGSILNILEFVQAGEVSIKFNGQNVDWMSDNIPIKVEGEIDTLVRFGTGSGSPYNFGRMIDGDKIEYWQSIGETPAGTGFPAVIFAPEDVTFTLNGTEVSLDADEYMILDTANKNYHIISPKPLVVQDIGNRGYLIAPSGIPATRPEVIEEEAPPDNTMIYIAIAAAAIVVVAALGYFLTKKKS
jgi:hypothetical protein